MGTHGDGFLCAKGLKNQAVSSHNIENPSASHIQQENIWVRKAKKVISAIGPVLLIVAVCNFCVGIKNFVSTRPVDDYKDCGIHTFTPYDILPVQVKTSTTRRAQRNNRTRTDYIVYYKTTDGTGYRWQKNGGSARTLAEQLYNRGSVERRVLSIPADNTYITVEAHQTVESYTNSLQRKYIMMMGLSGGYLLVYVSVFIWKRNQRKQESLQ